MLLQCGLALLVMLRDAAYYSRQAGAMIKCFKLLAQDHTIAYARSKTLVQHCKRFLPQDRVLQLAHQMVCPAARLTMHD